MADPNTPPGDTAGAVAASVAAPPAKPAAPAKPTPPKAPAKGASRRLFLASLFGSWFAIAWTSLTVSLLGMLLGTVRFLFPNVLSEPPSKFKVGDPKTFELGKVVERFKDQGAWIVRNMDEKYGDIIYALSTTCTHLGCTPNWLEREGKFKCPCHGSGFKITGVNFEGPAPRPLERWHVEIDDQGQLVVDKSSKYQKELGAWDDPKSFIKM
jgi:cytochrome b6-f complex iron-sulfur subunit